MISITDKNRSIGIIILSLTAMSCEIYNEETNLKRQVVVTLKKQQQNIVVKSTLQQFRHTKVQEYNAGGREAKIPP